MAAARPPSVLLLPIVTDTTERPLFRVTYARLSEKEARYWIPAHVCVCATHSGGVVLDLRRDKYFGLTRSQMFLLHRLVQAWPAMNVSESETSVPAIANSFVSVMLSRGLLTQEKQRAELVRSPSMPTEHTMADLALDRQATCRIRLHHLWNYTRSLLYTLWVLRWHTLERVAKRVAGRREEAMRSNKAAFDSAKAAQLTYVFRILKTFTHCSHGKCLLDSVCLLEFLARYRLYPRWVIGVTTTPFSAHSWVQEQHFILGSNPEQTIYAFTPIMIV